MLARRRPPLAAPRATVVPSVLVALALLVAAAGPAAAQFAVGTADVTFTDPDRGDRPVPADLYYPAVTGGADQPPADPPPGGFPAVAIGHGYLMSPDVYAWLAGELAAAGCVVAVARTGGELFPDHQEFGLDLAFLTRALRAAGDDPGSPFSGRMSDRALVAGHSMGGGASFLAAASDPTVTAVLTMAAAETDPSAIAACQELTRPVLLFAGTNDCVTPPADHQIPMYEALAGGWRTLVTLDGASHCQFNAYSLVCALGEACSADISRAQQQALVWQLAGPWVQAVLRDDAAAARTFGELLETTPGLSYQQAGAPTAAPDPVADGGPAAGALRDVTAAPNPFNPRTVLRFELTAPRPVTLAVYDLRGRRLATLVHGPREAGRHAVTWDGRDAAGRPAAAGTYLYRLRAGDDTARGRLTLVR
jgi:predicted dienelactone hydrolase